MNPEKAFGPRQFSLVKPMQNPAGTTILDLRLTLGRTTEKLRSSFHRLNNGENPPNQIHTMKKNLLATMLFGAVLAFGAVGCGTTESASTEPAAPEGVKTTVPIPDGHPFAQIKDGMSMDEVYALLGKPDDTSNHITGKAFIPHYYGGDTHRTELIYKGKGRIIFSPRHHFTQSMGVIEVSYNPNEK
jgi:hypothetical protein